MKILMNTFAVALLLMVRAPVKGVRAGVCLENPMSSYSRLLGLFSLLVLICLLAAGCSEDNPVSAAGGNANSPNEYILSLGEWVVPDTTADPPVDLPPETFTAPDPEHTQFVCTVKEVEIKKNFKDIVAVGANSGVMWPGALIQGETVQDGTLSTIPLPRSPITISIDLALENATRRIEQPNSASVQQAIAELQREADQQFGNIDLIPARLSFNSETAHDLRQMMISAGVSGSFSAPLEAVGIPGSAGGGFGYSGTVGGTFEMNSIYVKLYQPMYTISFADEEMLRPGDFLDPSVTISDIRGMESRGMIGPQNLPTYVKSVTYGRMMFFTMTNNTAATSTELKASMQASFKETVTGISGELESELEARYSELRRTSTISLVAFGGTQEAALTAVREGNLSHYFTSVPATNAVPISYRVNYLKNARVAVIGDGTKFKIRECRVGAANRFWITLDSIEAIGGCDNAVWRGLSGVDGIEFYEGDLGDVGKTIVVNRRGVGTTPPDPFRIRSELVHGSENGLRNRVETTYAPPYLLPTNPFSISHVLSVKADNDDICTVRFNYTMLKEAVYKDCDCPPDS